MGRRGKRMEENTNKIAISSYLKLCVLIIGAAAFYQIPYLRWTFYDGMIELSGLNNTQFGLTMTVYGTASAIMYFPGGIIADKIPSKILFPLSLIVNGICGFLLMTGPGYRVQMIIYFVLAAAGTLGFWASLNKAVITLDGGDGSRLLGLLEGGRGLMQAVFSAIFLAIYGIVANAVGGVRIVLAGYAIINIAAGAICFFILGDDSRKGEKTEPLHMADIIKLLKNPTIWLLTVVVIASYSFHLASTYMTPYLTNIIGATAVVSGALAIVRNYIAQMCGAPFGSFLATKTKSTMLTVGIGYIAMVIGIIGIVILPTNANMVIMVVFMIIAAVSIYIIRGIYFAIIGECGIPLKLTGTAVGIVSVIGFTPDIFMSVICGSLLDKYEGATGYRYIFLIMLGIAVIGLIASWVLYFTHKKARAE